jgi:holo-[acyl-carrier protein] synthase
MIIGIGTDIVRIRRIQSAMEEYGAKFLERCFTAAERDRAESRPNPVAAYARLFAAKEALLKALGTGMREGLAWHDWQILPDAHGAPGVSVTGGAARILGEDPLNIRLSMSDDDDYAVAFAVIEKTE